MSNVFTEYLSYGLSVIPVKNKICLLPTWKPYQAEKAAISQAEQWQGDVAIICGKVSGGVICIDFDIKNGDKWQEWLCLISEKFPEILSKLVVEETPSGGYHVIFRSDMIVKNIKLACNKERAATIETRGEGGYFVCAPSQNYKFYFNSFDKLQKITKEETEIILSVAASLNEYTEEKPEPVKPPETAINDGLTPCDDYNARHDLTGLLLAHGWRESFSRGAIKYFQRPNKDGRGVSASWNAVPDRFYVFSTATAFENQHIYKPSAVYAILEHNGNYSAAAKDLYAKGYGKRMEPPKEIKKTVIVDKSEISKKMLDVYHNGYPKGLTTGWSDFDRLYSVIKGQFTVITGMPSSGKSEFVDALMLNLAILDNWKFAVFAPENYPVEMHYHKLIEKIAGKPLRGDNCMTIEDMNLAINFINEHFYFIDATEDEINLESILKEAKELIDKYKIDALCLDPWNEIELDKPKDISSTEFIGKCLRMARKFARRNKIHLWIVAHPTKMQKDKNGDYPIPELYDIEGSAHWRNKADNGICVHRDMETNITKIIVQKIKYKYTGKIGDMNLRYDIQTGRYQQIVDFEPRKDF